MIRVAVTGALGRMGSGIVRSVLAQEDMELVAAIEAPGKEEKGRDIGELLGVGKCCVALSTADELRSVLQEAKAEVLIDFTTAKACVATAKLAAPLGVNLVIGTTGFTEEERQEIVRAVEENGIAAVISPNMATGVNVFFKIAAQIARVLRDYDVEIIEIHHRHKKDAPSGTALRVGELIAEAQGKKLEECARYSRGKGIVGERSREEIGFHAVRAGDIVGEHMVIFAGEGERLELVHRAHSRQAFVEGAIRAARFVAGAEKGKIYSTFDVLGI
ncbi:4-hydroxy-tetrahydrodipicolinate reductase [Candidatus Pyrohabitans sp.]